MNDSLQVARIDPGLKNRFVVFAHVVAVTPSCLMPITAPVPIPAGLPASANPISTEFPRTHSDRHRPCAAITGTAVGEGKGRYAEAVRALRPRFVLPSHPDHFFDPLESAFHFSALSDFPRIKAIHSAQNLPGRLILMDDFRTWQVPRTLAATS
jgi:hypothetical protein